MEENTPMQEVDTVPQGQPHSSAAAEEAATGTTTENAEAEGTTPARRRGRRPGQCRTTHLSSSTIMRNAGLPAKKR